MACLPTRPTLPGLVLLVLALLSGGGPAVAQILVGERELLARDRPEAWAMHQASAASLMGAFGETPGLAPGQWRASLDLAQVTHMDAERRRVGFNGNKDEDLNKAPVFGRLRVSIGLPRGWVADLGYTPPLRHDGARAEDFFALAAGRRVWARDPWTLSWRLFGQSGVIEGDITCPARLAGIEDFSVNPYGCQAPSRDRVRLAHYGSDLVLAGGRGDWRWHAGLGLVRSEPEVQVDALVFDARDRSRLVTRAWLPYMALGGRWQGAGRQGFAFEVVHVPLSRRRGPGHHHGHGEAEGHPADTRPRVSDGYTGLRLQWSIKPR